MDLEVVWSPEATEDLESIAEYIARDSEFYARTVVSRVLALAQNAGEFPLIGHMVPEIEDEQIRERFIYSYRLIYRIESMRVLVIAVIHGRQMLSNIEERLK